MEAWSLERPYTVNNPRWQLFAYSPLADIIETGTMLSAMYIAVWIADDPAETDGNPLADGGQPGGRACSCSGPRHSDRRGHTASSR